MVKFLIWGQFKGSIVRSADVTRVSRLPDMRVMILLKEVTETALMIDFEMPESIM